MDVELVRGTEEDRIVVRCEDSVLCQALGDLSFVYEDDRYAKRFPAGSFRDGILERFREVLVPLLRQTARLDAVPWQKALRDAVRRLDGASVDWWLAGGAALAVRGLQVEPRDIDLVISGYGRQTRGRGIRGRSHRAGRRDGRLDQPLVRSCVAGRPFADRVALIQSFRCL